MSGSITSDFPLVPSEKQELPDAPVALFGADGELVLLRAAVDPRFLEELLDALAHLDFPVNPELHHRPRQVLVEFPAYDRNVAEVGKVLREAGLEGLVLQVCGVLNHHTN